MCSVDQKFSSSNQKNDAQVTMQLGNEANDSIQQNRAETD